MVSVAVAPSFNVAAEGFTPHVMLLDDGVQVKVMTPLLNEVRFMPTIPELPAFTAICGVCGAKKMHY